MNIEEVENSYATKDLYFAAYLYVKGVEISKLEKYGGGKSPVYFIFNDKVRCTELENIFWNGTGDDVMINVREYTTALRNLRIRAFSVTMVVQQREDDWTGNENNESN